jgi:hypothetical protein
LFLEDVLNILLAPIFEIGSSSGVSLPIEETEVPQGSFTIQKLLIVCEDGSHQSVLLLPLVLLS